jgi:3-oxoadipate enol-lactonase
MWPLAERLSKSWRALVVHLPGYGRSAPLDPYTWERSHALLEEALASRGIR